MRNMSAVQGPMPRTLDRRAPTSSSPSRDRPRDDRVDLLHAAVENLACQVAQRGDLVGGQADRAQRLIGEGEQRLRLHFAVQRREQAAVNGGRRSPGELLVDDRSHERGEVRRSGATETRRTGLREQAGNHGVPGREDMSGLRVRGASPRLRLGDGAHRPIAVARRVAARRSPGVMRGRSFGARRATGQHYSPAAPGAQSTR